MGQDELAIVVGVERADPRVEQLHRVDTRLDLRDEVLSAHLGEQIAEAVPGGGRSVHQRLGMREVARVSAFDRVGGQGERCAGETDQRHAPGELAFDLPDRCENRRQRLPWLEPANPVEIAFRSQRVLDRRPLAFDEIEADAHRLERQQEIGEEIAASTSIRRIGCSVTSVARSGVRHRFRSE